MQQTNSKVQDEAQLDEKGDPLEYYNYYLINNIISTTQLTIINSLTDYNILHYKIQQGVISRITMFLITH